MEDQFIGPVTRLQQKVLQLLKQFHSLRKENESQKKQLEALQKENQDCQDNLRQMQEQVFILKASSGQMNDLEKKEFEQSIHRYIREIDKCITLLNE